MLGNFLRTRFKVYAALYVCFNVAGCATPAAWKYAERQASEPPTYRGLTDVYFAALRGPDQLRMCVLARTDSTEEPSPATLNINLEKISKSLTERVAPRPDSTSLAHKSIGEGSKLTNKCEPVLQDEEELVSIERIRVEGTDLTSALQQLAPEKLTVFVLEQSDKSHIVIGSPDQDFPGLGHEAFSAHAEDNASKAGYVLVPLAVVADAVLAVAIVIGAFFYGILCMTAGGGC